MLKILDPLKSDIYKKNLPFSNLNTLRNMPLYVKSLLLNFHICTYKHTMCKCKILIKENINFYKCHYQKKYSLYYNIREVNDLR